MVEERLNLLGNLKMKYGKTVEEILRFGDEVSTRAVDLETLLKRAESIDSEAEQALSDVMRAADRLSQARQEAARGIASDMQRHLGDLGMANARIEFAFGSTPPGSRGTDRIELHLSTHEGLEPGPIAKVASGGELSRLVLASALSGPAATDATLVFDEIDAGVGGKTALQLGAKLAGLAKDQQVLCVTHLPQLAAHADAHYVIERSEGEARVRRIVDGERLTELSRMIAGLPDSDRGQQAAEELLDLAGK
jgi:DNA repair protein RecN (Recombination protein N)